ncbi:MAPEG family protein [Microvirga thermotolerans]|uniref:MAPEG family protein n=1 Tax=Microvirga thermotolerans TaxID=2651334 RepID=A0A5P9JVK8_9HYPH|nr:MAPEG family protein [Microvirga thermotolerans]QFU16637.1 MAPEG family protein [Microvirga thermotolerans]
MSITAVLLPVFVQVGLTFLLLLWTGSARSAAVRSGEVKMRDIALGERNWPPRIVQVSNAYHNQLEVPVLFYVLVALALITKKADLVFVVMSWVFVVTRMVHAGIHVTTNRVPQRFMAFALGVVVLIVMWIVFALRIFASELGV